MSIDTAPCGDCGEELDEGCQKLRETTNEGYCWVCDMPVDFDYEEDEDDAWV